MTPWEIVMASFAKQAKDVRLDVRLPAEVKRQIEKAAALSGQTVSGFILAAVVPRAVEAIGAANVIDLSDKDARRFLAALDDDAKPNDALKRAARRYRSTAG